LRNPAYAPPVGPRGGRIAAGLAVPDRLRRDLASIDLVPLNPVVDTVLRVSRANAPDGSPS